MKIKRKLLLPVIIVILFILSVFVYSIYYIQKKNYTNDIHEHVKEIEYGFNHSLLVKSSILASHINYLLKDDTIQQTYKNNEKEKLYNYCQPIFNEIKTEYKITHFYFIDTTGTCCLRVHNKTEFNDTINRFTFKTAKQTQKPAYGIELGNFGTFTLRYVSPIIIDNQIAGYIELGMDIEHIMVKLNQMIGVDLIFIINKEFISKEKWKIGLEMTGKQGDWKELDDFIIINKTTNEKLDFKKILKTKKNKLLTVSSKDKLYEIGLIPLADVSNKELGKIIVLEDISEQQKLMNSLLLFLIGISAIVVMILLFFFYKYTSSIENNINVAYDKLGKAKKQAEESKIKLQETQKIAHLGYWEFDIINNKLIWSDEIYRIFGLTPQEFEATYEAFLNNIHPDDREKVNEAYTNSLKTKTNYEIEHRLQLKSGIIKYVIEKCNTEYSKNGEPIRSLGIVLDITDRKKAEQALIDSEAKLLESNKTKDKFFSIIAHDLKSPFNAILGFSDILLERHKEYDDEKREEMINYVNISALRAFKLVENLLTWSHSQSGAIKYLPENFHLKILLFETISALQGQADKKNIEILDSISENELIYADKNMLATILRNLISNAIKFTPKNGNIVISSKRQENSNFLEISVADTGIGIPKNTIDNLFRIDKNTSTQGTENETGTGLGLILCKEFVEKHGGEVWVESEEGKGSTFLFTIPKTNNKN